MNRRMSIRGLTALMVCLTANVWAQAEDAPVQQEDAPAQQKEANPMVVIETSKGNMTLELNAEKAPESVKNFLRYADEKFYDGTIFHRVIGNFMIQGGGFTPDMKQKPTQAPIKNEGANGLKNERGTIAMARTSAPDSATSQFFINVVDNAGLDHPRPNGGYGYAVFGKVVDGLEVMDAIKAVQTGIRDGHRDVPVEAVTIVSVKRKAAAAE